MERSIGQGLLMVQAPGNRSQGLRSRLRLPGSGSTRVYGRRLFPLGFHPDSLAPAASPR
jgi:hypothetical protein